MDSGADILIVDTRHKEEYDVDHIRGAVLAPMDDIIAGKWQPPAGKELILYCG
jgi:rhodanese-related sulfurtransferase